MVVHSDLLAIAFFRHSSLNLPDLTGKKFFALVYLKSQSGTKGSTASAKKELAPKFRAVPYMSVQNWALVNFKLGVFFPLILSLRTGFIIS